MSVVGLDIGSQTSFCGVARQGGIEVVANEYSKRSTETVVSLGDRMRHLGTAGQEKRISQMKATVTNFKRLLGLPFEHPIVQSYATGILFIYYYQHIRKICISLLVLKN